MVTDMGYLVLVARAGWQGSGQGLAGRDQVSDESEEGEMSAHIRREGQTTCALEVRSQEGETQDGGGGHKSLLPGSFGLLPSAQGEGLRDLPPDVVLL